MVSTDLTLGVPVPSELAVSVAVARRAGLDIDERLTVTSGGTPVAPDEVEDLHGTRMHRFRADPGLLTLRYEATVLGRAVPDVPEARDLIGYLRPSRYCESDLLAATAWAEFAGLSGRPLLDAVSSWVGTRLAYVPGSSRSTDGAVSTLLARQGVCRDYAHLCVALLRARDVPARVASVYAPGLLPMDFHAVCEAYVDERWLVVDATALAPRGSMLRIATGRDAADTAFITTLSGQADLLEIALTATVDALPADDLTAAAQLG